MTYKEYLINGTNECEIYKTIMSLPNKNSAGDDDCIISY